MISEKIAPIVMYLQVATDRSDIIESPGIVGVPQLTWSTTVGQVQRTTGRQTRDLGEVLTATHRYTEAGTWFVSAVVVVFNGGVNQLKAQGSFVVTPCLGVEVAVSQIWEVVDRATPGSSKTIPLARLGIGRNGIFICQTQQCIIRDLLQLKSERHINGLMVKKRNSYALAILQAINMI